MKKKYTPKKDDGSGTKSYNNFENQVTTQMSLSQNFIIFCCYRGKN